MAIGPDGHIWCVNGTIVLAHLDTAANSEHVGTYMSSGGRGVAAGADGCLWVTLTNGKLARHLVFGGMPTDYTPSTGDAEDVVLGPDDHIWYTTETAGKVSKFGWTINAAGILVDDGIQANSVPFSTATMSPGSGNLRLEQRLLSGTGLAYNSSTVDVKPIVSAVFVSNPADSVPSQLDARLQWQGSWGSWVTFSTSGHSAGDKYLIALQAPSAVSVTDLYSFEIEIKATWPGPDTLTRNFKGNANIVVEADNSLIGHGWRVVGADRLVADSYNYMYVSDAAAPRYFTYLSQTTYQSPPNDQGTLANEEGLIYTTPDQIEYYFENDLLAKIVDANGIATTYTYSDGRLDSITAPSGDLTTFSYNESNRLEKITMPGGGVVTVTQDENNDLTELALPDG
jgi:YD repeat-containing protein